jgi:hypothetical protein
MVRLLIYNIHQRIKQTGLDPKCYWSLVLVDMTANRTFKAYLIFQRQKS